ncbi:MULTISPECIES: DUF5712 family protein [Bacteroidales]|uniref:Clindamycin resistance transfer factor BtgB n=1 Tax=Parabacteroides gordonii MS-1 = DSM 23371 TaxID=1203610 RepID=A0A0F5J916_9BACT|nr:MULTISPECIES: DUF5712 family protein [Bacteroidales]KKB53902.1 hypothetical protein HMPREF1536_03886 [Parabacteroides gordonii MS-1 = DSM 23371]MCA5585119.1 DUF5712 family protein [Parabacteroides gordonii]RHA37726.1 clindamycin resistance transfer factor BtgB [Odoribacter splanchnicus]
MHIDFAPPSSGTYNNAGSSRQLASYMEHEDLERMEKGIYTDGFFNLTDDNIYKSKVIKDIDNNIGQLLKTDAKFFAIHVSPSESELRAMGNTEQEKAEAMKRYIREVFIPEYAKNFNKGLSEADIKFYGKIHFNRSRSDNELNMHCHLIVSRKDQANKKKLSPLTNHKNTKNGVIKGGFDRVNLFQQAEQGFDRLFGYNRQLSESFEYSNTMKNGSISEQLELQNQNFTGEKKKEVFQSSEKENNISCNLDNKEGNRHSNNQQHNSRGDSLLSIFSVGEDNNNDSIPVEELQAQKRKKKKKRGIRR